MNRTEIQKLIQRHEAFTGMVFSLIKSLLNAQSIKFHIVESRTKKLESLEEKIERKNINDLTTEITDISGVRIILYYQDDIDKVERLIQKNFIVDTKNSVNKEKLYESNEFGYLSRHYIVQVNKERSKLLEWKKHSSLKAEIQVRTVLQHSWASISHELSYKKNYDIPKELSRKLFRLASLFELADEQFLEIRNEHKIIKDQIVQLEDKELAAESIHQISLQSDLDIYRELIVSARSAGFKYTEQSDPDIYLSPIILASDIMGLKTIGELENVLIKSLEKSKDLYKRLIEKNDYSWLGEKSFFVLLALIQNFSKEQLQNFAEQLNWNGPTWVTIEETINELKSK